MVPLLIAIAVVQNPAVPAGQDFLKLLDSDQKRQALYSTDSASLYDWHYVPKVRPGIGLGSLSADQRRSARDFLKTCVSQAGFDKVEEIRALESVLYILENKNPARDREKYFFAFFGEPSQTKVWAWRFEGHHVSLTFAFRGGQLISSTPQFLGSNPANQGPRVLRETQDLAFQFLGSLSPDLRNRAIVSDRTFGDIRTGNARNAKIEDRGGVSFEDLDSKQRLSLIRLIEAHANVQSDAERKRRMNKIGEQPARALRFAWMGSREPGSPHYYRILGQDLIIEYDNSQGDGSHIHTVWRVPSEDFGGDLLADHYRHGHRH
jgi:hypothetical protein